MKTVEKIETLLNHYRERITLTLILTIIALYTLACEKVLAAEVPTLATHTTNPSGDAKPRFGLKPSGDDPHALLNGMQPHGKRAGHEAKY